MADSAAANRKPKDFYQILGVGRECTLAEISKAYKKLALKHHPDKNPDNREEADRLFKEISEAYHQIGDAFRRTEYDKKNRPKTGMGMGMGLASSSRMAGNAMFMQQFGMMGMMPGSMMRGAMPGPRGPIGGGNVGMAKGKQKGNSCGSQMGKGSGAQMGNGCGAQMGMGMSMMNQGRPMARPTIGADKSGQKQPKQMPMMNPMKGCGGMRGPMGCGGMRGPMGQVLPMMPTNMPPMMAYDVAMMMHQMRMRQAAGCAQTAGAKAKPPDGKAKASSTQASSSSSAAEPKATPAKATTAAGKGASPKTAKTSGKVDSAVAARGGFGAKSEPSKIEAAPKAGSSELLREQVRGLVLLREQAKAKGLFSKPDANAEKGKGKKRSLNAGRNGTEPLHERVQELCNVFSIEEKVGRRLDFALLRRPKTFEEDIQEIWEGVGKVSKPAGYLTSKCQEMERGVFATGQVGRILRELRNTFSLSTDTQACLVTAFVNEDTAKATVNLRLLWAHLQNSSDPYWTATWLLDHVMDGGKWSDAPPSAPPRDTATGSRSRSRSRSRSQAGVKSRSEGNVSASAAEPPQQDDQCDVSATIVEPSQEQGQCDPSNGLCPNTASAESSQQMHEPSWDTAATAGSSQEMDETSWDASQQWESSQQGDTSCSTAEPSFQLWRPSDDMPEAGQEMSEPSWDTWGASEEAYESSQQRYEPSWDIWDPADEGHSADQDAWSSQKTSELEGVLLQ